MAEFVYGRFLCVVPLVALGIAASCTEAEPPTTSAVTQAIEGVEGMMDVAVDAPWRLEPAPDGTYGMIPVNISINDAREVASDCRILGVGCPQIAKFCSVQAVGEGRTVTYSYFNLSEIEGAVGAWTYTGRAANGDALGAAPTTKLCRFWKGDLASAPDCVALQALTHTSEWHAMMWLQPPASPVRGGDLNYTFTLKLARDAATNCQSGDATKFVTFTNTVKIHLGEAALPRFGADWLYGDLHYHSQGTDNEGESGYAHRNVVRAMGALGLDFVLATEHASESEQVVDADIMVDVGLSYGWELSDFADPSIETQLRKGVLRDMSRARFTSLYDRLTKVGGVNLEAALHTNQLGQLPQLAKSAGVLPQLFLGGEVDVIPEAGPNETTSIPFGIDGKAYPLEALCKGGLKPTACTAATITATRDASDGTILVRDAQGLDGTLYFGRHHLLYFPSGTDRLGFVSSRTSEYGGATRRLAAVAAEVSQRRGRLFIAHPQAFPHGYAYAGIDRTRYTFDGGGGPDGPPWSMTEFRHAMRDPAVLGIEFWNENIHLKTKNYPGTESWGWTRPKLVGCLGPFCESRDVCSIGEVPAEMVCKPPPDLRKSFDGWATGSFGFKPWDATGQWTRTSAEGVNQLIAGELSWDMVNLLGINPTELAPLTWLPAGQPRKMFVSGGSDAHGDWNYRREGYLLGLSGVSDARLGSPRNLVYAPEPVQEPVVVDDPNNVGRPLRRPSQSSVLRGLESGNFTATDGPIVRIVVDENRNGVIDADDRPMGGTTNLYGEAELPILVEAISTPEFGAIHKIQLSVGVVDTNQNIGRVYRSGRGPIDGTELFLNDGRETIDGEAYARIPNSDVWVSEQPVATPTGEARTALAVMLPPPTARPREPYLHVVRAFNLKRSVFAVRGAVGENYFVRAFVATRRADDTCAPRWDFMTECQRLGKHIRRFAYSNPVWFMSRVTPRGTCPTDGASIDKDGDGLPDGCDTCVRVGSVGACEVNPPILSDL